MHMRHGEPIQHHRGSGGCKGLLCALGAQLHKRAPSLSFSPWGNARREKEVEPHKLEGLQVHLELGELEA